MKLELLAIGLTTFFLYNAYHDGKYTKMIFSYKKYFQMGFVALLGLSLYLLIKRDPQRCKKLLLHANNVVKYMPIDKTAMSMLNPVVDFTHFSDEHGFMGEMSDAVGGSPSPPSNRATKRSVSETKKKFVASSQNWKCGACSKQLNHTFEIDHKIRLEYGGTNDVDNLIALCRNCHGEKTARENM
jgi:hypothetical protein